METCADCGKPINWGQPSYYKKDPAGDFGKTYHSECGDPFGTKKKDAEIERLHAKLATSCRQWKMYAEMEEGRDLLHEQSPEGDLYRSVTSDEPRQATAQELVRQFNEWTPPAVR